MNLSLTGLSGIMINVNGSKSHVFSSEGICFFNIFFHVDHVFKVFIESVTISLLLLCLGPLAERHVGS